MNVLKKLPRDIVRAVEKYDEAGNPERERRVDRAGYRKLSPAIGKRLILKNLKDIGLLQDVTSVQLERADTLIRSGGTGDLMDFPHSFGLRIAYEEALLFTPAGKKSAHGETSMNRNFSYRLKAEEIIEIPELNACLRVNIISVEEAGEIPKENGDIVFLDGRESLWEQPLYIRTRRPGDSIVPLGMQAEQKNCRIFL